jgi:formate dehydrogenase major subunit
MSDQITFTLNGNDVTAEPGETIWQVADRLGIEIPHLCYSPKPGYRADGNCRACMVEVEGERVLAASCIRPASEGMKVNTVSDRAKNARKAVFELLLADQPKKATAHDPESNLWKWTDKIGLTESRYPARDCPTADNTHPAMGVNLDACIHCNLCVRACREVQVNDVIGMAGRGIKSSIVFDMGDGMGDSSCVACGECVQACPTGALMPSNVLDKNGVHTGKADRQVESLCPFCGVGCQVTYNIRNDKILFVEGREGPSNKNRLCVKGRFGMDYVHHPERLTVPLIRKEGVAKDAAEQLDPANPFTHFREATWEEALDRAAEGLTTIRNRDGSNALAGFGSAKGSNEEAYLVQKLVRTGFQTNNVDHCTRLCHASSVAALMEGIGSGAVTAPFMSAKDADVIIVIGAHPTQNHPVAATFFKNAAHDGKTLIIMDPRRQALSRHANHHLQFTPGRDVPLLNAMIHTIIEEGLTDENYIKGYTEGFDALKAKVKDFSPEKMADICGIDAETIRTVARKYATAERSIIFWGMGISQHVHGTDNARCLIALSLITGHVGRPGTGLHPLRGQNNVQGASDAGLIPMLYPDYQSVENGDIREKFEAAWGTKLDPKRGLTVVEIADAAHDRSIKGIYVMGENPAMSDPNASHAREAMARLEHLVVQDIFLTETAFLADVVFPATAFPEKDGTFSNTNRQVQIARQAIDAPGDARQDWWIIQEIANRVGLEWSYTHPKDVFAEMRTVMPSLNGITWERLERENSVTYPCDSEDVPGHDIVFGDGFPTASKRGKLVPTEIVAPYEMPDDAYPLILTTGRMLEHWHTGAMTRRASRLDALEPVAVASFHPNQLDQMDIGPGDTIRIASRRGEIEITARADRDVPVGMVFIPFCFNEAAANLLTSPQLDPVGKIPEFKFCAVKVEKVRALVAAE